MSDGLTLPDLLDELARHGLRVASVTMGDGKSTPNFCVATFTAVPVETPAASAPARQQPSREIESEPEPDALGEFVRRKEPRESKEPRA